MQKFKGKSCGNLHVLEASPIENPCQKLEEQRMGVVLYELEVGESDFEVAERVVIQEADRQLFQLVFFEENIRRIRHFTKNAIF